jgi:hypothetical protein
MRALLVGLIVSIVLATSRTTDAQYSNANDLLVSIEETLAAATHECALINEARTRLCVKPPRLSISEGHLTVSQHRKVQLPRDNYTPREYTLVNIRTELADVRAVTVDPIREAEPPTIRVSLRCGAKKRVFNPRNGESYDITGFQNIRDEVSAGRVAGLLEQLIATCKLPAACR